ncbi:hypothetical protein KOW79_016780 [Hemibagrus wyckioides]|uniref:Serine/threonine-protein kinase 1 n=1 Tax=Hemibagrus wyckioides TaxID=337641 RepID=A0A9D3NEY9_9TELE|nr:hypothetical protein KOW79_016780 [Hemibagrus wyckioides]
MLDLLQEESESQLNERPNKRRRANSPQKGPLSTEAQSEASCPYSLRPRKENPLKRKMVDLLQGESESQLNERPNKRRRTNSPQKEGPLSTETQSETSCSYSLRSRKGNPLKRKLTDLEEPETPLMEMRMKRRRNETEETKETKGVLSAEIQSEESCKEETTDLPQEQMPKEQRKPETKKNNIHSMNELLSTCSEPSDSFSTEDHDVSDPQPEDLPDDFTERYTLGELLGSESNAKVYAGIRKSDGEQVAIKYLLKCFVDHFTLPDDTRSLPHEGMMMEFVSRSRSSPYVIKLLEWFETPKGFLLVMERPQNFINLQQFRRGLEGRMSEDVARIIIRKIIQALIHCRECGVLHLDVKEHNILVNPETLDLKLTDFSQARLIYGRTYRAFGELLSTYSEPSDSFSTEDHDVSDPQPEDLPDDFTERYTLGELLGSESNAKVYTGIRKSDGEQVAIKYLLKCFVDHFTLPDDTRSLPHEGMMMEFVSRSRSSPYVIKLHEWFETPKGFLLVMERPQNFINLQQFRRGLEGRMSEDVARIIMLKIIQALIHCRECGVLHLDVKEHNILVNPETLDLKLTDFSQARLIYGRTYRAFGELLSTCSEPSDSFSTEDHDVSDPQPEDLPDDFTERYTLGELLGSESNAKVYAGIRKSDGEQVAIKYLLKCFVDYFTLPDDTRSLPHEGMMMEFVSRSRSSPYVIKLHEWFETPKGFLLVMERPQNFITPQKFRRGLEGRMSEDVARIIMRKIKGPLSTEAQSEASWPYSLRPRKENPLKRKMLDLLQEESESQLNERPNKRRRANSPQKGPLSTEAQSEASCPYSLRPRKENPLKRKMVDLLQEESESQLKERPKKRRRTNSPQKEGPLSTETQSETSCSYSLRSRKGNPLKRKLTDLEEPETPLMEMRMKRRRNETEETKETKGVLSAEIQSEESCKEETTDLPQEQMPKEQRKPETKKNNIHSMNELLSTCSEPSDSFSTEDHDVSDPQPEDLPDDFTERYTLRELLGSESNAKVYAGIRKSDGEQVAIKYLLKCFVDHFTLPDDTRSLPHEGMMMEFVSRSRSSPYVIKLLEWFETPKGFLLVMERPQNFINLQQFRRGLEGRMSEDVARIIMRKIIQALIHCRECGVLHLDVKEHNILVNPETLDLKLTDFSQARLIYSRTYRAFGGPPVFLPINWLATHFLGDVASTVRDLGLLLCTLTWGENTLDVPIPLSFDGLSKELLSTCSEPSDSFSTEDHDVSDPQPEDLPDDFTERYTLGELLGSESNAKVYTGIRKSDGEQVAIKYLLKCFVDHFTLPDDTRSLPHEGMMMEFVSRSRSSPYVIKLHEWFETPKGFLLVMERPQNFINLQQFRRGLEGRMSEDVARIIMLKIIQALIHCRECGVLHLDVKEHNILVNPETLDLKLTDFSQARLIYSRTYRAFGELLSTCSEPSDSFSTEDHDVSDPQPEDLPDDFTERYTLGELLGSESNTKVYTGIRKSDGEQVAIKYLLKCFVDYFTLPDDTRSLPHEGMMMEFVSRSRSSPYVIKLHEWFETPKGFLLVMERPQNFITPQKFRRGLEGRMSEDVARIIMRKISQASKKKKKKKKEERLKSSQKSQGQLESVKYLHVLVSKHSTGVMM